ncbi:DHHC zinc finger domain containing protein [Trichomonas vaginalis G3]|uniref:Palmitoyltransferase n=1 Tax=Trichomonas vaginalis (strain ATCC PRA-98 / G3) TaxID=412133 RepID=A2DWN6_TRIV3|nr:cysteine S-palmitoyltransferase protein [Trichomonas vaginalis G3]EAY15221.1 DHHC zinc finger domain containing protein [Trichomonas vaginalis G3]KAI5550625.1 cysteine S-palmitoyltransferase protein [Trichomonas vaginalis G3]|eukprot:XP_001327444.1 DHHC zinc finger domain containing protein [Trichomonas vaginalis G3]
MGEKPKEPTKRKPVMHNLRNFNIMIHMFAIFYYTLYPGTRMHESFISSRPYYFLFVLAIYLYTYSFFGIACFKTSWVTASPDNVEGLFYCKKCKMYIPCRAAHCKHCGRCVLRRDHHCPWTGCCIGQNNHQYFLAYLMLNTIYVICVFQDIIYTYIYQDDIIHFVFFHPDFIIMTALVIFSLFFSASMASTHLLFALGNRTTFEQVLSYKLEYLRKYPPSINPFSYGPIDNFIEFCQMGHYNITWDVPPPPEELGLNLTKDDFPPKYFKYLEELEEKAKNPKPEETDEDQF